MFRGALLAVLMVAGVSMAHAQQPKSTVSAINNDPLVLYVANGSENACGRGCGEWIAAEGAFDPDSSARFRNFLTRLGRTNLPVFFDSPGGLQNQAKEIGRIMRERGMSAGVARTLPETCAGGDRNSCLAAKKSGKKLRADWTGSGAKCNSACVYAFVGARERQVPSGSSIGVHSPKPICISSNRAITDFKEGKCAVPPEQSRILAQRFMKEMGIDLRLVETIYKIPYSEIHFLSRQEIETYKIESVHEVKRSLTALTNAVPAESKHSKESSWKLRPGTRSTIVKIMEFKTAEGTISRSAVEAGCHYSNRAVIGYFRPAPPGGASTNGKIAALVNGQRFEFSEKGSISRFEFIDPKTWFDRREVWIPSSLVGSDFDLRIEISDPEESSGPVVIEIPTDGFHSTWKTVTANG
jgi:hypothetical protein